MPPAAHSSTAAGKPAPQRPGPFLPWWQRAAGRLAVASGVFCLVTAVTLVVSLVQYRRASDPLTSLDLKSMKAELVRNPQNNPLKAEIRSLDLRLRAGHDQYLTRLHRSQWLLFGSMVVFIASIQSLGWRRKIARPGKEQKPPGWQAREILQSSVSVAVLGSFVAVGAWWLTSAATTELRSTDVTVAADTNAAPAETLAPTAAAVLPLPSSEEVQRQWPRFRGPRGDGVAFITNAPVAWNAETGEGILWKNSVPLTAPSSPIAWGDKVFVTGGVAGRHEIFCFDATTGKMLWQKTVGAVATTPAKEQGEMSNPATPTPATDGRYVFVMFGNGDVAAFDFQGNAVWTRSLGKIENQYGVASSLTPYRGTLILQLDQGEAEAGLSRVMALDSTTGKTAWESAPRPVGNSWTSPILINAAQREQLVTAANPWVIAYDPSNGTEFWRAKVCGGEMTPSPTFGSDLVFTAVDAEKLTAIRPDGSGDVTTNKIVWRGEDGLPDIVSPLCDGQRVYTVAGSGLVVCYDAPTGKKLWEKDFETEVQSSPVAAGNRVYLFTKDGVGLVFQAANEFKEISRGKIGEDIQATPAFLDGRIFVRGKTNLFCLGRKK